MCFYSVTSDTCIILVPNRFHIPADGIFLHCMQITCLPLEKAALLKGLLRNSAYSSAYHYDEVAPTLIVAPLSHVIINREFALAHYMLRYPHARTGVFIVRGINSQSDQRIHHTQSP